MSVSATSQAWDPELCREILEAHRRREGALLPILHAVQDRFGWVPDAAVELTAEALNLSRAEVHGVLTFYHDFRRRPPGRRIIKLCQAEACQARGGRAVTAVAETLSGLALGETSTDGEITLEGVFCLGLCASGPAALVGGHPVGRLEPTGLAQLLKGETA